MRPTLPLVLTALLLSPAAARAQTSTPATMQKDDLFAGTEKFAKNASDVTELNMDPQSLNMVQGKDAHRAHRMVLNVVRTYEYDKPGMYNIADVEGIRNRLNTGDWHCSVHTRDSKHGESTDICNRNRNDGMVETAIITVEPKELTFIHTIKQGGEGGGGMSESFSPVGATSGAFQAQMAIMRAQMAEQMAMMKPQMSAMQSEIAQSTLRNMPRIHVPAVVVPPITIPEMHIPAVDLAPATPPTPPPPPAIATPPTHR